MDETGDFVLKFGKNEEGFINFQILQCPYCGKIVKTKDYIEEIDPFDYLREQGSAGGEYVCEYCGETMQVFLDAVCKTERLIKSI